MFFAVILACDDPFDNDLRVAPTATEADADTDTDADADTDAIEHCGVIAADEVWAGDRAHWISCDVEVVDAMLRIEAGAAIAVADGRSLLIGADDHGGSLEIAGTSAAPVVFSAAIPAPGQWDGLRFGPFAGEIRLDHTEIHGAGGGTFGAVYGESPFAFEGLRIVASGGIGLELAEDVRIDPGSTDLVVTDSVEWAVSLSPSAADSIPGDSDLAANAAPGVWMEAGAITTATTWADLGVPYVAGGDIKLDGTTLDPAVLTLGPGVEIQFDSGAGLRLSSGGGASGLRAIGTASAPIVLTAWTAGEPGAWDGVTAEEGTLEEELWLAHVHVLWAGGEGAIHVADSRVVLDRVEVTGCLGAGVVLEGGARLGDGSGDLTVTGCDRPLVLAAAAVADLAGVTLLFAKNAHDETLIDGGAVSESGTWPSLSYWVEGTVSVDGTATDPATLTISAGSTFYMGANAGLRIGDGGAAAMVARGTESEPIRFTAGTSPSPGAWSGIGVYAYAIDAQTILDHVEVAYGGGSSLQGNLHLADASPSIDHAWLHHSENFGLYVAGDSAPEIGAVTYEDNGDGDTNLE